MSNKRKFNLISTTQQEVSFLKSRKSLLSPISVDSNSNSNDINNLKYLRETTTYESKVFMASLSTQKPKSNNNNTSEDNQSTSSTPIWNAANTVAPFRPEKITLPLVLTPIEKKLFDLFKRTNVKNNLKTTIRVAGGWVRDKLMGKDNDDIDLALDDMTGAQYAKMVHDMVIEEDGGETVNNDGTKNVSRIGIIKANPDQSKHLETATMFIYGQELDFVNLRSETYTDNSRIPEMTFGTALNDASRRDFTINALFYNVNTDTVEDLTEHGISDLKEGILRTPLDPLTTFADDPLRILRAIKFASRYAFRLEERIINAVSVDEVRLGITTKCSQDRVGKELSSMLSCKRPVLAFRMIDELNLWPVVYGIYDKDFQKLVIYNGKKDEDGKNLIEFKPDLHFWINQFTLCVSYAKLLGWVWHSFSISENKVPWNMVSTWSNYNGVEELNGQKIPILRCKEIADTVKNQNNGNGVVAYGYGKKSNELKEKDLRKVLFLTVLALPFETLLYKKKNKQPKLIEYLLLNSLKATTKNLHNIQILLKCSLAFQSEAQKNYLNKIKNEGKSITRADIAFILNDAKSLWPYALDIAMIRDLIKINGWSILYNNDEINFFKNNSNDNNNNNNNETNSMKTTANEDKNNNNDGDNDNNNVKQIDEKLFNEFIKKYQLLYEYIENENIDCIWLDKPLMDGKVLMKQLDLKPGPAIRVMMEKMKRWQYNNPNGIMEECKAFLLSTQ